MKKNVTVQFSDSLIKKARHLAVEDDVSLAEWIRDVVEKAVTRRTSLDAARKVALKALSRPLKLGGKALTREEIYES
jgi:hypothetical protein